MVTNVIDRLACSFVLTDVGYINHGLHGEQGRIVEPSQLVLGKLDRAGALAFGQRIVNTLEYLDRGGDTLVRFESFVSAFDAALQHFHVGENELHVDGLQIAHGIDGTIDVNDVFILKATDNVQDRIYLADVRQKFIAQALTLCCTADKACDVNEFDDGWGGLFRGVHLGQIVQT